jgi:hypothetical protein
VYLADDYLEITPLTKLYKHRVGSADHSEETAAKRTMRFLRIGKQLPFDLQMVLSNRVHQISKDYISTRHIELSLKEMAIKCGLA